MRLGQGPRASSLEVPFYQSTMSAGRCREAAPEQAIHVFSQVGEDRGARVTATVELVHANGRPGRFG